VPRLSDSDPDPSSDDTHALDGLNGLLLAEPSAGPNTGACTGEGSSIQSEKSDHGKHYKINKGIDFGKTRRERQK